LGWLHWSFGDFLDKTGLTDLLNRPDWFPLPVSMVFYTDRYRTGNRGNRFYRFGAVTVSAGKN
jgi:hypothetical protein